ncbi:hypothetical protein KKA33_03655 [Patescibacteria group bacterium]|nr:hypothetical protein [Patescibacteria group bacterium]
MVKKPNENAEIKEQASYRDKIRHLLRLAQQLVHKDPLKILEKVARIIDIPHMNDLARRLCLLLAEESPKELLDNKHLIKSQIWAEKILKMARANMAHRP